MGHRRKGKEIIEHSLEYMQSKSLHTFVDNIDIYKENFKNSVLMMAQDSKAEFITSHPVKKVIKLIK